MANWHRLTEARIRKAEAEGTLSGLAGEGRLLPERPGDALIDPSDAVGYRIMAEAGALPEEITLKARLDAARADWQAATIEADKRRHMARIADLQMRYEIARDARRKFLRQAPAPAALRLDPGPSEAVLAPAMTGPRYPDLIARLPATVPFTGPEEIERVQGHPFRARLGANENVYGPSPKALTAMQAADAEIWKYADPSHLDLKTEISTRMGCRPANIVFGEGIDGCLGNLVRLLVAPGDPVVTSDGAYPTFAYHVNGYGGTLHKVPYRDDHEDIAALFAKAAEVDAKIVYLSNPDNPMGTWHDGATIEAALEDLPDGTVLALDEAYIEFAPEGTAPRIDPEDPRVIRFRTFSKAYGMAGARVGYAVAAAPLISAFDKVRNHFSMNRSAQHGALAALQDEVWLGELREKITVANERIATIAAANGLATVPTSTNFVAVDCGHDGAFAKRVLEGLARRGVFVRMPGVAPLDRCIRVSAGTGPDLDILAEELPKALAEASAPVA